MSDRVPLRKFVEHVAERASRIFNKQGSFSPMYHYIDREGRDVIMLAPPTDNKDKAVAIVRATLEASGATRVAFLDEAWVLDSVKSGVDLDMDKIGREGISKHPNRFEVLIISAEDQDEGLIMATREIIRSGNKTVLGKLTFMEDGGTLEGRMVGLLPSPTTRH